MKIIVAPSTILSEKSEPIVKIDRSILKIIEEMKKTLDSARDPIGVGLAAPQIGKNLRIFITKPSEKSKEQVFINPVILKIEKSSKSFTKNRKVKQNNKKEKFTKLEGCLSLENIWGTVRRSPTVTISFLDENSKKHTKKFDGLFATIVQHEIDHLDGILFPRRVLEQKEKLYRSRKENGEDIFDEIELP